MQRTADVHIIDYGHVHDGVLYHATLSDIDGIPRATWTYEGPDGQKRTHDSPIDGDSFELLWNGFSSLDVFARNMVTAPDTPLDPVATHVIGLRFRDEQGDGHCTFSIPADEADPDFMAWLFALEPPYLEPRAKVRPTSGS